MLLMFEVIVGDISQVYCVPTQKHLNIYLSPGFPMAGKVTKTLTQPDYGDLD